jgi:hypothetical protein
VFLFSIVTRISARNARREPPLREHDKNSASSSGVDRRQKEGANKYPRSHGSDDDAGTNLIVLVAKDSILIEGES